MPTWETTADWDNAQEETGTHHEQPTGTQWSASTVLEKGYPGDDWANVTTPEPFLYWPLGEQSGTTANDVTASGNDGTNNGATVGNAGGPFNDDYYTFDGTDDRVDVTFAANTISYPFTLACWVNTVNTGNIAVSVADKDDTDQQHRLGYSGTNLSASSFDGAVQSADTASGYADGAWHFAAARFVASNDRRINADGGAETATDTTSVTITDLDRLTVGVSADSSPFGFFNGSIVHVMVWDQDITDAQISELYQAAL